MNREFKFRAWDKEFKQMTDDVTLYANGWIECFFYGEGDIKYPPGHQDIEIMQYTGLKDKNGKEIYEGGALGKKGHWSFYIGFKDACFVMIPCNPVQRANWTWHPIGQDMIQEWEVIGNIYENSELLEGESE